ncbi:MAG: Uma2 family endonuclease [Chloroflexota bacterium]
MAVNTQQTPITVDDLMQPEFDRIEIINGVRVEKMTASVIHHVIARNIFRIIDGYTAVKRHGEVFFDGLHYLMYSSTPTLKDSFLPDTSFVRNESIPKKWNPGKPYPGVPTLAIEVISDSESAEAIGNKVSIYLGKGTEQVWVVYPTLKEVHQYINGDQTTVKIYRGSTHLEVEALFPGLELTTDQIFAMPDWVTEMQAEEDS